MRATFYESENEENKSTICSDLNFFLLWKVDFWSPQGRVPRQGPKHIEKEIKKD